MRTFAIIHIDDDADIGNNILKHLPDGSKAVVYTWERIGQSDVPDFKFESDKNIDVQVRVYPTELRTHWTKLKNFVSRQMIGENQGGFVHVLEDTVEIYNSPDKFLDEIERMMVMFQLKSWFNTSCDICNYVYSKYNPRLYISIDETEAQKKYDKTIAWCSNANTIWVCYNTTLATFNDIRFEERFRYPMYYIIEFLARRRNTKKPGQLDYMNYYPSIPEELDVFRQLELKQPVDFSEDEIRKEGEIFTEMKVDNHPDSNLDILMEDMRNTILKV